MQLDRARSVAEEERDECTVAQGQWGPLLRVVAVDVPDGVGRDRPADRCDESLRLGERQRAVGGRAGRVGRAGLKRTTSEARRSPL
jgi:hypothetical protein